MKNDKSFSAAPEEYVVDPDPPFDDTAFLLEQQAAHEKAKAEHIAALLKEQTEIAKAHDARQGQISAELLALGWKKPRAARTKKEQK